MSTFPTRDRLKKVGSSLSSLRISDGIAAINPDASIEVFNKIPAANLEKRRWIIKNEISATLKLGPVASREFTESLSRQEMLDIFPDGIVLSLKHFADMQRMAVKIQGPGGDFSDTIVANAGGADVAVGLDADIYSYSNHGLSPASLAVRALAIPEFVIPASEYVVSVARSAVQNGLLTTFEFTSSLV